MGNNNTVITNQTRCGAVITAQGAAIIADCILTGKKLPIVEAAAGDGGGSPVVPSPNQTALVNERWRGSIVRAEPSAVTANMIDVKIVIGEEVGGFVIREMGLFSEEGVLIAVCNTPDTEKVPISEGVSGKLTVNMHIVVADVSVLEFTITPALDMVSRPEMESAIAKAVGEIESLSGTGEPNAATAGQVGQKYEDTTSGDIYTCTAITPGESGASPHYLWVPGRLGTLAEIRTAYSNIAGRIIGQQILRNAYWMTKENIINQREKLLYNKNGYTIDGWILWDANTSLEVVDQGLVTHSGGSIRQTPLVQKLEVNCLIPGIYTLSIFATKNVGFPNYFVEDIGDIPGHINADSGLVTFTFEVPDAVKDKTHWVSFEAQDDSLIKAAKLEPGPTQTLAHKDAAGNWVLNDPMPDKGLELLKCQRYLKYVSDDPIGYGYIGARGDAAWLAVPLSVPMRTTPTLVTTGKKIAIRGNGIEKVVEMSEVRVDRLRDDKILLKIPMTGIPAYTSVIAISAEANYDLFFSAEL